MYIKEEILGNSVYFDNILLEALTRKHLTHDGIICFSVLCKNSENFAELAKNINDVYFAKM